MGLDIYFYKTKKYEDCKTIDDFYTRGADDHKKEIGELITKLVADLKDESKDYSETYHRIFHEILPEVSPCNEWVYEEYQKEEYPLDETIEFLDGKCKEYLGDMWESAYFRKANFVYRYFQPKLQDEQCFVTKKDLEDLIARCRTIMETDGKLNKYQNELEEVNADIEETTNKLAALAEKGEDTKEEQEKLNGLVAKKAAITDGIDEVEEYTGNCETLLPTQAGFFFGSTDYDELYFYKVESCFKQMNYLLKNFNEVEEVIFVAMSW